VLIALSIFAGYLLLICLLGWALVRIPIVYWNEADYGKTNNILAFKIAVIEE
jgi:hypothetical protein